MQSSHTPRQRGDADGERPQQPLSPLIPADRDTRETASNTISLSRAALSERQQSRPGPAREARPRGHDGIHILGALGRRFDPRPAQWVKDLALPQLQLRSGCHLELLLSQELHMLGGGQKTGAVGGGNSPKKPKTQKTTHDEIKLATGLETAPSRKPERAASRSRPSWPRGGGATPQPGQQPAASFEPLGPEVFVVKVLGHLLQVLHVGAEREEEHRAGHLHHHACPGHRAHGRG